MRELLQLEYAGNVGRGEHDDRSGQCDGGQHDLDVGVGHQLSGDGSGDGIERYHSERDHFLEGRGRPHHDTTAPDQTFEG
jgi:hypothetical protein